MGFKVSKLDERLNLLTVNKAFLCIIKSFIV